MKTTIDSRVAWGAIVIIVLVAGALYLASTQSSTTGSVTSTSTPTSTQPVAQTPSAHKTTTTQPVAKTPAPAPKPTTPAASAKYKGNGTVASLFALKEPLVCSVGTTGTATTRYGTMYVANKMMRANFVTYTNGGHVSSYMIDDGTYLYAWMQGATTGRKVLANVSAAGSAIAASGGMDLTTPFTYSCNPWTENASYFTPPTSVSFTN